MKSLASIAEGAAGRRAGPCRIADGRAHASSSANWRTPSKKLAMGGGGRPATARPGCCARNRRRQAPRRRASPASSRRTSRALPDDRQGKPRLRRCRRFDRRRRRRQGERRGCRDAPILTGRFSAVDLVRVASKPLWAARAAVAVLTWRRPVAPGARASKRIAADRKSDGRRELKLSLDSKGRGSASQYLRDRLYELLEHDHAGAIRPDRASSRSSSASSCSTLSR